MATILIIKLHESRKKNEREKERARIRERMHKPLHFLILPTSVISYHIDISSSEHEQVRRHGSIEKMVLMAETVLG